jgi:tetratricopeptide (TPR) repeat protein
LKMDTFEHPEWFWGLLPVAAILLAIMIVFKRRQSRLLTYYSPANLAKMGLSDSLKQAFARFSWWCLGMIALLVALANPRIAGADKDVEILGSDVVFVLDISRSMRVEDIAPSRLHVARQFLEKLISEIPGERVGLVFFAGAAYVQMPLSADHAAAKMFIRQASPDLISNQGTAIGAALSVAADLFDDEANTGRTLVLVTDGEDHEPEAMKKAGEVSSDGIDVLIIGVGTSEGGVVPQDPSSLSGDDENSFVLSRMSPEVLRRIAKETKGQFMILQNNSEELIRKILSQLQDKEKTKRAVQLRTAYTSLYLWPLGIAILCFMAFLVWPFRGLFLRRNSLVTMVLFFTVPLVNLQGQSFQREMKKGEKAFDEGDFQRAITHFGAAAKGDGEARALFNRGTSRMADGDLSGAQEDLEKVIKISKDSSLLADASYQLGNVLLREENWEAAEKQFIKSLKWKPGDPRAAHNLMFSRKKKQETSKEDPSDPNNSKDQQSNEADNDASSGENNEAQQNKQPRPASGQEQNSSQKMSKKEAEKLLEAMQKEEAKARARQKMNGSSSEKSGKNW